MAFKSGQWFAVCDVCGFRFLSSKLKKRWDGFMVDEACWETRHPQEFLKIVEESEPAWINPEPEEINISAQEYVDAFYYQAYDSTTGLPGEYTNRGGYV